MSELQEMNSHLQSIDKRLDRHIGVAEVIIKDQQHYMERIEAHQNEQSAMFMAMSDKRREELTTAVLMMETQCDKKVQEVEKKAKLIAWVAGSIMGIITTAIGLVLSIFKVTGGST